MLDASQRQDTKFDGEDLMRLLAVQLNIHIQILSLPDRSVHVVEVTDYSNMDN